MIKGAKDAYDVILEAMDDVDLLSLTNYQGENFNAQSKKHQDAF